MKSIAALREDELLGRVLRNSAQLFSSNSASLVLSVVQGILAARILGAAGYGLVALVMSYASTINGLLSFRMSELVVRYGGEYLERGEKSKAAALLKLSSLTEAAVSVVAFLVVTGTAGIASRFVTKAPGTEWMFTLYALGLLFSFNTETATGVLQVTNKIRIRGAINLVQAVCSAAIIAATYVWMRGSSVSSSTLLLAILGAYLVGKAILGIGLFLAAWRTARRVLDVDWKAARIADLLGIRQLLGFGVSSNLSATAILIFRESEVLWVGILLNSEAAGLFKVAFSIAVLLAVPADPLILSVYPEANRLVVQRAWLRLRDFLRTITIAAFLFNALLMAGFALAGRWLLSIFGPEFVAAYPALLVLLAGFAFNYTFFWNRPVLLSLGQQSYALGAIILAGILKVGLALPLVPRYGYVMEAILLGSYYVLSVGLMAAHGLSQVGRRIESKGISAVQPSAR